jgi:hypothetical protein
MDDGADIEAVAYDRIVRTKMQIGNKRRIEHDEGRPSFTTSKLLLKSLQSTQVPAKVYSATKDCDHSRKTEGELRAL